MPKRETASSSGSNGKLNVLFSDNAISSSGFVSNLKEKLQIKQQHASEGPGRSESPGRGPQAAKSHC
ncbi:MAG: hypothetical protein IKH38_04195 [Clostridia bacterium]|nr:hypothetical protein [Clostridia bacterium]